MKKIGPLLQVDSDRDAIWLEYLMAFPEESRQEHNCNCCKAFIRQMGSVVVIDPNSLSLATIWDVEVPETAEEYKASIDKLRDYVRTRPIKGLLDVVEKEVGKDKNYSEKHKVVFQHFYVDVPECATNPSNATRSAGLKSAADVLKRGLIEITDDAFDMVMELIAQGSLYRGETYKKNLEGFLEIKSMWKNLNTEKRDNLLWLASLTKHHAEITLRNTAIGTLLTDLSEGRDLEQAVKAFETIVAPTNYKRPTALTTPRMVEDAKKKLESLGMLSALERRRLDTRDMGPANALFIQRGQEATKDIFAQISAESPVKTQTLTKCEEVPVTKFISDVLPTCKNIRLLVENRHMPNFATLTGAVDPEATPIFSWNNSFGWSYTGGVADSMRERVSSLGGRVDGCLRFTHSWNHDGKNQSLMDLHVFMPGSEHRTKGRIHNTYPNGRRVGWNCRKDTASGGVQDVDHTSEPGKMVPIENISFPDINKMPEGNYQFYIHNWQARNPNTSGFEAEIEFGGELFQYSHPKAAKHQEWIKIATATLDNKQFTIVHHLEPSTGVKTKWGVTTNQWRNVKIITESPNQWNGRSSLKHLFFILEGCVSDEETRPFYNEFLCRELAENRKVMEVLASKIKVASAEGQELSGLGFSEDTRNHVFLEIEGKIKRAIKVLF